MILYFSATGNSKHTAEKIAERFNDKAVSIEGFNGNISLSKEEIFGIVTPVYFWGLPITSRTQIPCSEFCSTSPSSPSALLQSTRNGVQCPA